MERYISYAGEHNGKHLFVTPSWTDKIDPATGMTEVYEITVTPVSWMVRCNCFGSNKHKLYSDLLHPDKSHGCKHAEQVALIVKRHLRDESPTDQQD